MSARNPISLVVLSLVLALLAPAAPGQSGEEPTIVSVGNVNYMNATNYWFGSGFPGAPGAVPLGYTFIEPAHWNGHVLVSIVSGGYRSVDVEEIYDSTNGILATGFYNQALPNLRLGFKVVFLTHGDASSPDDLSTPNFIVREIRDQIHEGLSDIRATQLDARGGLIGVGGGSSGGALVMELMTKPRLNGNGVTSEPDLGIAVDAPVDLFNWRFTGDHGGFYQFGAQAVHPDISGNGSFPVPGPDPDLPGLRAELFPSGTPGVSNNIGQWTVERGNPQVTYTNGPEAFPHRNRDLTKGVIPTWGQIPPKAAEFINMNNLNLPGGTHPGGVSADYPQLNAILALPTDSVFLDLKPTTNPVLMTASAEDEIVPYPQFKNFISQVWASPLLTPSDFLTAFRYYSNLDVDHGGRGDEDREALVIASAFRCEHLLGQMDGDFDLLDEGLEAFHGTNTQDSDTDGDGMLDGCEVIASTAPLSPATVFSDPLDPADGLRVSAVERIASQTVRLTAFMPGLNPNSSDYCIQTGTNLNTNASKYSWIDICPFSPSFTMNQRTFDLMHAPLSAGESIYFRIRRDSPDFDMASCDPVALKAIEIKRDPTMSVTNYIGASLIPREARGKVVSVTSSGGTATVHLERPLGFDLQEGIRDIIDGQNEWALVVIRDPANQPEELLKRDLNVQEASYQLPDRQEVGLEGHWWPVISTSGGLPSPPTPATSAFGDTAIEVQLRVGAGVTNATDLTPGCTVALRKMATVEQVLGGPIGSPDSPFRTGDIIRLYQRDGIIAALHGSPLLPVATANFRRHEFTFVSGGWVENGSTVSLADFTLHPDECFEYLAAPGTTSDIAVMAGWVPMADIKAYLPGIPTVEIDGQPVLAAGVNIIKHFPYPEDCRERITEPSPGGPIAVPSMGLIEAGMNYASECTLRVPWPIGVAPPTVPFIPGDNQGFWYTFSTEDPRTSNAYWGDPEDPYWYISDDPYLEPNPETNWVNTLRPFLQGPVLPSGRGRIIQRLNHPLDPDSDDNELVEWGRRRPYPWRL